MVGDGAMYNIKQQEITLKMFSFKIPTPISYIAKLRPVNLPESLMISFPNTNIEDIWKKFQVVTDGYPTYIKTERELVTTLFPDNIINILFDNDKRKINFSCFTLKLLLPYTFQCIKLPISRETAEYFQNKYKKFISQLKLLTFTSQLSAIASNTADLLKDKELKYVYDTSNVIGSLATDWQEISPNDIAEIALAFGDVHQCLLNTTFLDLLSFIPILNNSKQATKSEKILLLFTLLFLINLNIEQRSKLLSDLQSRIAYCSEPPFVK